MNEPSLTHPRLTLAVASGACALIILDTNIVAASLPTIARDLSANLVDIEWVVSAYLLSFAALLLPAGSLADRFGRRYILQLGLVLFMAASIACAMSPSLLILDLARAAKGIGAAMLLTSALASIGHCFQEPQQRARAWAAWGTCMGLVIAIAPLLGGLITALIGWRWIFWLNLPLGLLLLWAIHQLLPESRDTGAARVDPLGALTFSAALACLMWGLIEVGRTGWSDSLNIILLLAGLGLLAVFVWIEARQRSPMIDLSLFRHARFNAALLAMFAYAGCAQVMMTLLPFYLQNGLGFSSIESGLGMLPFALAMLVMPRVGGHLAAHWQPASLMSSGLALVSLGNLLCASATLNASYLTFAFASIVLGAGAGLLNGDTQKNIMACIPPDRLGMGSGMSTTMRFSAISLAIGIYGALLSLFTDSALSESLKSLAPQWADHSKLVASRVAAGDLASALEGLPEALREPVGTLARHAFIQGFGQMLLVAALAALVAAVLVGIYLRRPLPGEIKASSPAQTRCRSLRAANKTL